MDLILASTSPYRASLLSRLNVPFRQLAPSFTETYRDDEAASDCARRLARGKAQSVSGQLGQGPWLVIGSDQVAHLSGRRFDKPGSRERAHAQLAACSGRWVAFESAIALIDHTGREDIRHEVYEIHFRELTATDIDGYLDADEPYDCAGSIRAESQGITLLRDSRGRDFNTLIGLPLMLLQDMLADFGINVLSQ